MAELISNICLGSGGECDATSCDPLSLIKQEVPDEVIEEPILATIRFMNQTETSGSKRKRVYKGGKWTRIGQHIKSAARKKRIEKLERRIKSGGGEQVDGIWSCKKCPYKHTSGDKLLEHLLRVHGNEKEKNKVTEDSTLATIKIVKEPSRATLRKLKKEENIKRKEEEKIKREQEEKMKREQKNLEAEIKKKQIEERDEEILKEGGRMDELGHWCCLRCGAKCEQKSVFLYHLKRSHNIGNFEYKCPQCDTEFRGKMALRAHVRRRHDDKDSKELEEAKLKKCGNRDKDGSWWCSTCGMRFIKTHKFIYHLNRIHNIKIGNFEHKCPHCDLDFIENTSLKAHVKSTHTHEDPKDDELQKDGVSKSKKKGIEGKEELEDKLKKCGKQDEDGNWWCSTCGMRFIKTHKFIYHLKRIHNIKIGNLEHKCPHCDLDFREKMSLRAHVKSAHTHEDPKVDKLQKDGVNGSKKKRIESKENQEDKLKECGTQDEEGTWWCSTCGMRFIKTHKFIYHLKRIHNIKIGNFEHKCPHCDMDFRTNTSLKAHVRTAHTHEDPKERDDEVNRSRKKKIESKEDQEDKLKECGKQDEDGNWWCSTCGMKCIKTNRFIYHLKKIHNIKIGNFEYKCPLCDMEFIENHSLKAHVKSTHIHKDDEVQKDGMNGSRKKSIEGVEDQEDKLKKCGKQDEEGNWWCSTCGMKCIKTIRFINHLKRIHNIKIGNFEYKCPLCDMDFRENNSLTAHVKYAHTHKGDEVQKDGVNGSKKKRIESKEDQEDKLKECGVQDEEGTWWCSTCGTKFISTITFIYHLKRIHKIKIGNFEHKCPHCDMDFRTNNALKGHTQTVHLDPKVRDDVVNRSRKKAIESKEELEDKLKECGTQDEEGNWWCSTCGKRFTKTITFVYHLNRNHNIKIGSFEYKCPLCDMDFKENQGLKAHLKSIHTHTRKDPKESLRKKKAVNKVIIESATVGLDVVMEHGKRDKYGTWLCNNCSEMYEKKSQFIIHLKKAHNICIKKVT